MSRQGPERVVLASYLARNFAMAPYGAAVLAAHVKYVAARDNVPVSCEVCSLPYTTPTDDAVRTILAGDPTIAGVGFYVWNYDRALDLVRALRLAAPSVKIVAGGPHLSRDDETIASLLEEGVVDACVLGEGEKALESLIFDDVPISGYVLGEAADFDSRRSPYATETVLRDEVARTGTAIVEGARGCPFSCTFCDQGWRKARLGDEDHLRDELRLLVDLGARHFIFLDPTFNFNRGRMRSLLEFLRTELPGTTFGAELKIDLLNDGDVDALSGVCAALEAGLQTTNLETLKRIQRPEKLERIWENAEKLMDAGIAVTINTIFGLPGDDVGAWLTTLDDCYRETRAHITATCLKVLPNTQIWTDRFVYDYVWDEHDLFRATSSSTMSSDEFVYAERIAKLLRFIQPDGGPIPPDIKSFVDTQCGGLVSGLLVDFERGALLFDQTRGFVSALEAEPA